MKKYHTIADLGEGGHGWVVDVEYIGVYHVSEITIGNEVKNMPIGLTSSGLNTLMPRWVVSIHVKSDNVETTRCKEMFANTVVYPTREEAEKALDEVNERLGKAKKEKFLDKIEKKHSNTDWKQVRINASISILNSLLETTPHSVAEEVVINDIYAKTAIAYADTLIKELKKSEDSFEKLLEL